ncbi:exostosin-like glycosyltransferase [Micractinium conductrix]|uniref:Exostosin-like glycosyltransferase n=1 Tax=Micractinium conductrix TaxID=554055 RepID=A0A2P6VRN4_9CHLO|nr:exostosin-like glycosyltransferase [Micractinium conductrix]|eukprot:PSC76758.1 exostosin-like glycosyltransferase [Micractinium conductrix]
MAGWCRCPAGWSGDDCSTRLKRPCSWDYRQGGFEPFNKPVDWSADSHSTGRCSQYCDEDVGLCFCGPDTPFGRIPPNPLDPPGTPPIRRGRPMAQHCQPSKDPSGKPIHWGTKDPEEITGPQGYCMAQSPASNDPCPCIMDGYWGPGCDEVRETYCPNQCNGHGECMTGFCKCHRGWWGHDCAYRTPGTPWTPGMGEGERPWLRDVALAPASKDPEPGATRKRPLIYVYELPPMYNNVLLQYRPDHGCCVHRFFKLPDNQTYWNDPWVYASEPALHEALLQSEHRTLDPEEADFFYVPVYTTCYIWPLHEYNDGPFFHASNDIPRVHGAINMLIEVHSWIRSHLPYWDRHGGRDHIVLQPHDEGSCWLPAVLRPAILLAHWGRTDAHHVSGTGYSPDNYTFPASHPLYMPEGIEGKLGDFPCYDPAKDLVIPAFTSANKYPQSPLLGAPARQRNILGFFKGRTQQLNAPYSRGIRQTLENLCNRHDWWGKHKITIGEKVPEELKAQVDSFRGEEQYSALLASSTFCFALPGDGWSARLEDAVLHGCIPVIIQDGVHMAFEDILDYPAFSLCIAQADMEKVPEVLQAVSPERVLELQQGLAKVWRRFTYTGLKGYHTAHAGFRVRHRDARAAAGNSSQEAGVPRTPVSPLVEDYDATQQDGLETLYSWLYSRIPHTRGPAGAADGSSSGGGGGVKQGGSNRSSSSKGRGGTKAPRKAKEPASAEQ